MPNDTNQQNKLETNPPPPSPLQIHEPPQQIDNFPTHDTILTITGSSNTDFDNKRQRRDYYKQGNHVTIEGPIMKMKWSHIPIIFSAQDINLASLPHTDVLVIIVHIDRWNITRILVDNGSQVEILFLSAFEKMGYDRKQLKEPMKPLYDFSDKRIEPVRVITLPISFDTPQNP
jgi:hypothetical protein